MSPSCTQNYQRALLEREILPSDQIRALFMNLDTLVDFQRKFLIGVEANARLPPEEQRFGHLFITLEHLFGCYEPFCANFASASQLAQDENPALMQVADDDDLLDPNYELPTFLIKPVQRICKYPLLLQQLVKHSDPNGMYYNELKEGLALITKVTDGVNEVTRQRENELAVNDLKERVEDWKGHEPDAFGNLVLEDTFTVVKNESEREYHVYLFERIILCCKEVGAKLDKKTSKQSLSLKKSSQINNQYVNGTKRKNTQQLKGRIFIANVMSAIPRPLPPGAPQHQYLLQVTWRGDVTEEHFSIKCRSEEQLKKWQAAITKAVDDAVERRRRQVHHLSSGSRSRMNSPLSLFPNTPQSEMGPPPHSAVYPQHLSLHHPRIPEHPYTNSGHGNGAGSISGRTLVDEDDSYTTDCETSTSGHQTPSGARRTTGHRSMPAERSEMPFGPGRARAQTDDSMSTNMTQWRSQMPTSLPPLPRTAQTSVANSEVNVPSSLRSSTSSRHLRHKQSHEWGMSSATSSSTFRTEEEALAHLPQPVGVATGLPMTRHGGSFATAHHHNHSSNGGVPMFRSRSASSPNIHQHPDCMHMMNGSVIPMVPSLPTSQLTARGLPVPNSMRAGAHHTKHGSSDSSVVGTDISSMENPRVSAVKQNGNYPHHQVTQERHSHNPTTLSYQSTATSSLITSTSNGSGHTPSASSSSPAANGSNSQPTSIRFRLRAGEDTYVIVTLSNIGYDELIEKIQKKLRNCGVKRHESSETGAKIKIRYEDEEGDLILICNDEDIGMAVEWMKSVGTSHLLLFVE